MSKVQSTSPSPARSLTDPDYQVQFITTWMLFLWTVSLIVLLLLCLFLIVCDTNEIMLEHQTSVLIGLIK